MTNPNGNDIQYVAEMVMLTDVDLEFPFHLHCEYCHTSCKSPIPSANYVMVTNIWNEKDNIRKAFQRMEKQTKKPDVWLWIDDGSTDESFEEIQRLSKQYPELEIWIERMPQKKRGDLNTIGRAYTHFMPGFIKRLKNRDISYFTIQDVTTQPCPNYFARIINLMEQNPSIGACSGYMVGEEYARESGMPMGDCKVVRWNIIRNIKKYWDLSPDTYVNIKTLKMGYKLKIWKIPVLQDTSSFAITPKGMFYQGQINYFIGRPFLGVVFRALRRLVLRRHGTEMLRGYIYERLRGVWRCDDKEVLEFYGFGKPFFWPIVDLILTKGKYTDE